MTDRTHIHLNIFLHTTGHHEASWLYPNAEPERTTDVGFYREVATIAERGKFDSLFLADQLARAGPAFAGIKRQILERMGEYAPRAEAA